MQSIEIYTPIRERGDFVCSNQETILYVSREPLPTPRSGEPERQTPKRAALSWERRLKVIASIEEPQLIERILAHRRERGEEGDVGRKNSNTFGNVSVESRISSPDLRKRKRPAARAAGLSCVSRKRS